MSRMCVESIRKAKGMPQMADSRNKGSTFQRQTKGYVPVILKGEHRAFINIAQLKHPLVLTLLQETAREQGYSYNGPLRLPCDQDSLSYLLCYEHPTISDTEILLTEGWESKFSHGASYDSGSVPSAHVTNSMCTQR
ncbi:hypothetical protein KP509_1Z205500 [Ceratopteris richardii]|nr:hypothetical protein KP509_1Z205500 [Ceratopteris richardii]